MHLSRPCPRFVAAAGLLGLLLAVPASSVDWRTPPAEATRTASGLVTLVLEPGSGTAHPDANDLVSVRYVGRTLDGKEFQNAWGEGVEPRAFLLARVFPGWREAIGLMVQGEKRRAWIPAELAPKYRAEGPMGQPVVFDIELVGLIPVPDPPPTGVSPPADGERLSSGGVTVRISAGFGDAHPVPSSVVLLHYIVWTADGQLFDTSYTRMRPTLFPLSALGAGLTGCVREMVEGEARFCWLPNGFAPGEWPRDPKGPVVLYLFLDRIQDGAGMFSETPPPSGGR